jgi:hypothetical protein
MAATTARRRLTDEERAARVEALTAELAAAVAALTVSTGWRSMLEVSARFRRYSSGRSGLFEVGECCG